MTACCPIFSWREWSMKVWSRYFPVVLTDDEGQKSIVLGELLLTFDISSSLCGDDSSVFLE